jgi:hypothetical protein
MRPRPNMNHAESNSAAVNDGYFAPFESLLIRRGPIKSCTKRFAAPPERWVH